MIKLNFKSSSRVSPSLVVNKRKRERKGEKSGAKREGGENTRGERERERMSKLVGGNCYPKFKLGCRLPLTRFAMGLVQ